MAPGYIGQFNLIISSGLSEKQSNSTIAGFNNDDFDAKKSVR